MNVTFKGSPNKTGRDEIVKVGDKLEFKGVNTSFQDVEFNPTKLTVVSSFPAISTSVCDFQTRGLGNIASKYADKVDVLTISLDLPPTLGEWCGAHGVDNVDTLSDWRHHSFAKNTGLMIEPLHLLHRTAILVDKDKKVLWVGQDPEMVNQIDFVELEKQIEKHLN